MVPAHARAPSLAQRMANVQDQETLSALDAKIQRVVTCEWKKLPFWETTSKNANFSWSLYDHRDRSLFIFGGEGLEDFGCVKTKFTWTPLRLCGSLMISSHKHYTCYSLTLWHCAGADWSSLRSPENHSISSPPHPPIIPPPTQP